MPLVLELDFPNEPKLGVCVDAPVLDVSRPVIKRVELPLGERPERGLWLELRNRPPLCGAEGDTACHGRVDVKLLNSKSLLVGTVKKICVEAFEGPPEPDCPARIDDGCAEPFGRGDPRSGVSGANDDSTFNF